jgi:tetratricopeptide (TPR) repeat protein
MFGWFRKKASPSDDDLDPDRATEFFRRGDFAEALRRADVILEAGPLIALSWRFKGECLFQLGQFDDAEVCFGRADEIGGPGTEEVLFWAALCMHNVGRSEEAVFILKLHMDSLSPDDTERRRQAERALAQFRQ